MRFRDRIEAAWSRHDSMLCIGLDPDLERLPEGCRRDRQGMLRFLGAIIEATKDLVCAYKPQVAHFAALGAEEELEATIAIVRELAPHALVILDAKRGDVGSTATRYAREAFVRYGADAVTVNPYTGGEGVAPFTAWQDRGTIALCRTSNATAAELQDVPADDPLYLRIARLAGSRWNAADNVMLVAGATCPEALRRIRAVVGEMPLLVPGVGAQGGPVESAVTAGLDSSGRGLVLSSSRGILYAGSGADYAAKARAAAERTCRRIATARADALRQRHASNAR